MNNNCCNEGLAPAELARRQPKRSPYNSSETLFTALDVYYDDVPHSAGLNMAVDEALLQYATHPVIRFYRWRFPALSIGYFGRFADVATYQIERDLVRRWTGGGIVFHGEDLTYSIVIPANNAAFFVTSISVYEEIHRALCAALAETGQYAVVAHSDDPARLNASVGARRAALSDAGYNCFTTPVRADLLINGRKVAGAAQRRTRRGLLQQGSIQGIDIGNGLAERFAQALSASCREHEVDNCVLNLARELAQKYESQSWLRKR